MKDQCIPYELELKLKELGCNDFFHYMTHDPYPTENKGIIWQQAFDWFREKHNINAYVIDTNMFTHYSYLIIDRNSQKVYSTYADYDDYKDAQLNCLNHLIKIIHERKTTI